jgi:hypothetical protein
VENGLCKLQSDFPNWTFHEDTLKYQLWNALKELKIRTSNEEGIWEGGVAKWKELGIVEINNLQMYMPLKIFSKGDKVWLMAHLSHP